MVKVNVKYNNAVDIMLQMRVSSGYGDVVHKAEP
jgi:hypothetical protein